MICDPCKSAGRKLKLARQIDPESVLGPEALRIVRARVVELHAGCLYPDNCPCQHRTA